MDLNGKEITDPKEEMSAHQKKYYQLSKEIDDYYKIKNPTREQEQKNLENETKLQQMKKSPSTTSYDYQAQQGSIGFSELKGRRETQEDRVSIGDAESFMACSEAQKEAILIQVPAMLQTIVEKKGIGTDQGATFNLTINAGNKIYISSIGDSTTFLYSESPEQTALELLSVEHNLDENELDRLVKEKFITDAYKKAMLEKVANGAKLRLTGKPPFVDVKGGIAVCRSIGDRNYDQSGLSHKPDITIKEITIPKNGQCFIINACDGLTECEKEKNQHEKN